MALTIRELQALKMGETMFSMVGETAATGGTHTPWRRWFAWHPVRLLRRPNDSGYYLDPRGWTWLTTVGRRRHSITGYLFDEDPQFVPWHEAVARILMGED